MIEPNKYLEKLLGHLESDLALADNLEFKLAHAEGVCAAFRDSGIFDKVHDWHWRARFRSSYRAQARRRAGDLVDSGITQNCRNRFEIWASRKGLTSPQVLVDLQTAGGAVVKAGGYLDPETQRAWEMWQEMTLHGVEVYVL